MFNIVYQKRKKNRRETKSSEGYTPWERDAWDLYLINKSLLTFFLNYTQIRKFIAITFHTPSLTQFQCFFYFSFFILSLGRSWLCRHAGPIEKKRMASIIIFDSVYLTDRGNILIDKKVFLPFFTFAVETIVDKKFLSLSIYLERMQVDQLPSLWGIL